MPVTNVRSFTTVRIFTVYSLPGVIRNQASTWTTPKKKRTTQRRWRFTYARKPLSPYNIIFVIDKDITQRITSPIWTGWIQLHAVCPLCWSAETALLELWKTAGLLPRTEVESSRVHIWWNGLEFEALVFRSCWALTLRSAYTLAINGMLLRSHTSSMDPCTALMVGVDCLDVGRNKWCQPQLCPSTYVAKTS